MENIMMQKLGIAIKKLSIEFINFNIGDRIPTVAEFSEKFNIARGTVQSAIKFMQEYKAILLEPRGKLGTFIKQLDYIKLIEFSGNNYLVGIMPLPYSKRYEGLASGIYNSLKSKLNINLMFTGGSNNRLKALKNNRCDFMVTSRIAAEEYIQNNENIEIAYSFGNNSYVNEHVLAFREGFNGIFDENTKIGIDKSSIDQFNLTKEYFKNTNVELVQINYGQFINALNSNEIDAVIWNLEYFSDRNKDVLYKPLDIDYITSYTSEAVIITNKKNAIIRKILEKFINKEEVIRYQKDVIEKRILPNY